jgi:hypothetical protein
MQRAETSPLRGRNHGHGNDVKIDEIEPNFFPAVHSTDVDFKSQDQIELVLITPLKGVRLGSELDWTG